VRNRVTKSRSIIAFEDVPAVFDDDCIQKLATIAELPPDAEMTAFGAGIREAARIFARDARRPNANELHYEIASLHEAADRQSYERVADLLEKLSPQAREMLEAGEAGHQDRTAAARRIGRCRASRGCLRGNSKAMPSWRRF
jgi:hypothetical protein